MVRVLLGFWYDVQMDIEHELRILEINPEQIEDTILKLGGKKIHERIMQRRYTYNVNPETRNKWVRLRTNGKTTTLAIKHVGGEGISDTKEIEIEVSDFETTANLLEEMGVKAKSYQENYRTLFELDGAEIMLDEWPLIPPYIEIEAATPELVAETIKKMDFEEDKATGLDVSSVYEQVYKIDIDKMPELKFNSSPLKIAPQG